jgi:transcriptional regulator with XRE-family HTH domain
MKVNRAIMHDMGIRIRAARELLGLTQTQLAAQLEVDQSSIADWEAGNSMIHASHLPLLAEILNVSILFFFEDAAAND